jgi:hypothetical protein
MNLERIFAATSAIVLIVSLVILVLSIRLKNRLTSEAAWDRMLERVYLLRAGFFLTSISLALYLIAESAELLNKLAPSDLLLSLHIRGEVIHMLIALGALLLLIPIFKMTVGGGDD